MKVLKDLPPYAPLHHPVISCSYGADLAAAAYCGLAAAPAPPRGIWQHGWLPEYYRFDPTAMIGGAGSYEEVKETEYFWLARKDQEDYLREHGYVHARAIGLPLIYLPPRQYERIPGSLLVMPLHSTDFTTHQWNFEEYADTILALRDRFQEIVACVHPSCWQRGYWVDAFRKRGIPVIQGATSMNRNSLLLMQTLLSSFEYVTTNGFGSQIAYGAYWGAKPSIYGKYVNLEARDFANDPLSASCPHIIEPSIQAISEETLRQHFPFLFCSPDDAPNLQEWGKQQVGEQHRVSPAELRRLFGWNLLSAPKEKVRKLTLRGSLIKQRLTSAIGDVPVQNATVKDRFEFRDIVKLPPNTPGSTRISGKTFEFIDGRSFLVAYDRNMRKQMHRFATANQQPYIIDGSADIGLSLLYFKDLYPHARITAFEPDSDVFQVLERNSRTYQWKDVELVQAVLGTSNCEQNAANDGLTSGAISTRRLRDLLIAQPKVEFLKIDMKHVEGLLLEDCIEELKSVERMFIRYYSYVDEQQDLHRILDLMNSVGFRYYLQVQEAPAQPLYNRPVEIGKRLVDMHIDIFCYRAS